MNVLELLEGGGLLVVCVLLVVFAVARSRNTDGAWPSGILPTNVLVLLIIASGFFGLAAFIDSFVT
jgi:hypothetical protein